MSNQLSASELGRQFIRAVEAGDEAAARICLHPQAKIWHNFDAKEQSVDENMATLQLMIAKTSQRDYQIHRIEDIENGYLQRHSLTIVSQDGSQTATAEALALVTVEQEKITYIEEFIDPTPLLSILRG